MSFIEVTIELLNWWRLSFQLLEIFFNHTCVKLMMADPFSTHFVAERAQNLACGESQSILFLTQQFEFVQKAVDFITKNFNFSKNQKKSVSFAKINDHWISSQKGSGFHHKKLTSGKNQWFWGKKSTITQFHYKKAVDFTAKILKLAQIQWFLGKIADSFSWLGCISHLGSSLLLTGNASDCQSSTWSHFLSAWGAHNSKCRVTTKSITALWDPLTCACHLVPDLSLWLLCDGTNLWSWKNNCQWHQWPLSAKCITPRKPMNLRQGWEHNK